MKHITDKELYSECRKWGTAALQARWKFAGLLPEVYKRKLYKKRGYSCIYEFAARLSGMTHDQVDQVLRLNKRFSDKPVLKTALTEGKVSANKLARIASIATKENQNEILEKTETLSKAALEIFVKETRKSLPGQGEIETKSYEVNLDDDVKKQLSELQNKGININDLLRKFLKNREEKIEQEMQKIEAKPTKYRYINVKTKQILAEKFGTKCSSPDCNKPAEQIHHEQPFAIHHSHDPRHLKPLCKAHHELQHSNDNYVQKFRSFT